MELITYGALLVVTVLYGLTGYQGKWTVYPITFMVVLYLVAARYAAFDADMNVYATTLTRPAETMLVSPYYLREWAYWVTSSLVYEYTGSAQITFLIYDLLALIAVARAGKHLNLPHYFIGLAFVLFVSVMGVQNIYRQFLASCILLLALVQPGRKRWITFLLAGFTQNAAFLFAPLMFSYESPVRPKAKTLLFVGTAMAVLIALPFVAGSKSSSATGADLRAVYLAALFAILLATIVLKNGVLRYSFAMPVLYTLLLTTLGIVSLGASQAERIGMMSIFLLTPLICALAGKQREFAPMTRAAISLILAAPALIFPAARIFLLS